MSKLQAYYNGTGLFYPSTQSASDIFKFLDEGVKDWPPDNSFYLKQLTQMEEALVEAEKELFPDRTGVCSEQHDMVKNASKILKTNEAAFYCMWFSNIRYLTSKGVLEDDLNNGFLHSDDIVISDIVNSFYSKEKESAKVNNVLKNKGCNLCDIPSTKKCSKCKAVYYCCVEHQRADWKSHKLFCKLI